jgi:hypothetical protein
MIQTIFINFRSPWLYLFRGLRNPCRRLLELHIVTNAPEKTNDDRESSDETRHSEFYVQRGNGLSLLVTSSFRKLAAKLSSAGNRVFQDRVNVFVIFRVPNASDSDKPFRFMAPSCQNVVSHKRKPFYALSLCSKKLELPGGKISSSRLPEMWSDKWMRSEFYRCQHKARRVPQTPCLTPADVPLVLIQITCKERQTVRHWLRTHYPFFYLRMTGKAINKDVSWDMTPCSLVDVGLEVLTAVVIKVSIFYDIKPSS